MRAADAQSGLTALAIAGTNVVLVGWDMAEAAIRTQKVLGFALERRRHSDGEVTWMPGMKTFEAVEPDPAPGVLVSSYWHPLQTFQWSDYSVSPQQTYTYRLVARCGQPTALTDGPTATMTVTTERTDLGRHAVFFNRGSVASQEYARRFQNLKPSAIGPPAFNWLSRGLVEGLESFIAEAGANTELYGAFFEFKNGRIHSAIKAAKQRGAKIKILYDGDSQLAGNEAALQGSGITSLTRARTKSGRFAHNKFLILRRNGVSEEVWTGSTNLSENGIFGHSNNAHLLRDPAIAEKYYQYWLVLESDVTKKPTAQAVTAFGPIPPVPWTDDVVAVFSPQLDRAALDWYAALAGEADRALFMTFAFGMDSRFVSVYDQTDDVLRFALMEKKGNGSTFKKQAAEVDRIRRRPNTVISVGNKVQLNNFDRWLTEIDRIVDEAHVLYVHTKYMLIDPLGPDPIVVIGSANFSAASTDTNDENMLVIKGDDQVADIYLGEFMRLFSHYAFRESLQFKDNSTPAAALKRKYLIDNAGWIDGHKPSASYFRSGNDRFLRRLYFSGQ